MTMHIDVWKVTETKIEYENAQAPTDVDKRKMECNAHAINALYTALESHVFEQIKDLDLAHDIWKRLEETYEGTQEVKNAKVYMLREKFGTFKMNEDESVPEMFNWL
jgi:Rad3-related DNA helicase